MKCLLVSSVAVSILCTPALIAAEPSPTPTPAASPASSPSAVLESLPANGYVTLETVAADFGKAPEAALKKYKGQTIVTEGKVVALEVTGADAPMFVVLLSSEGPNMIMARTVFSTQSFGQGATVSLSDAASEAVVKTAQGEQTVASTGDSLGVRGTFEAFDVNMLVLEDAAKVDADDLKKLR